MLNNCVYIASYHGKRANKVSYGMVVRVVTSVVTNAPLFKVDDDKTLEDGEY